MPIYIDVSAAVHGRAGLGRYAASLARSLHENSRRPLALFYNRDDTIRVPDELAQLPAHTVSAGYKVWRMAVWLGQLLRLDYGRLVPGAELFHATEHLLLPLARVPTVLTVHDLIYRLLPKHHKVLNYVYLNAAMPLFSRRADAVIAISESTKSDLVRLYRVPESKVTVVYEAPAPLFRPVSRAEKAAVRARYDLSRRFLLFVGTIEPRKNLCRLLDALALLRAGGEDVDLVIVGSKGWLYKGFLSKLETYAHGDSVRLLGYVPDDDLRCLYGASEMLVLASLYEGFGLPVLEAMASGAPVACSRVSSLPELGGDAALYFDPMDVEGMAATIGLILGDASVRESMRESGLAQAARFSWERTALETLEVYDRVLGSR